jgi:hypothetical protein
MKNEFRIFVMCVVVIIFVVGSMLIFLNAIYASTVDNEDVIIDTINTDDACSESLYYEYICNNYLENETFNSCRYKALTLKNCGVNSE